MRNLKTARPHRRHASRRCRGTRFSVNSVAAAWETSTKRGNIKLDRVVALKMILSGEHAGAGELARFEAEAKAVASLQHANLVQIYEVGLHEASPIGKSTVRSNRSAMPTN